MLYRSSRLAVVPVCALVGLLLICGCSTKRSSTRASRTGSRMLHHITPGPVYNPPAEPTPLTPPAPGDAEPPPPTRSTSDLPEVPPSDDFESAEKPGRYSASFGPYSGRVNPASKSSDLPDSSL
jgi:hypothetical protein